MDAIEQHEWNNLADAGTCSGSLDKFLMGLRVLVVDDDVVCLKVIKSLLSECGYNVTACREPKMALSLLRENKENYDIVLTDIRMPKMNGFQLLEIIRSEMDIPVILISADSNVDTIMKGIRGGACDYITKPGRMEQFKTIWQHVVRKREQINPYKRVDTNSGNVAPTPIRNLSESKENDGNESDSDNIAAKKP